MDCLLQNLSAQEMSVEERKTAVLALLNRFKEQDEDLLSNPVYLHLFNALSNE